MMKKKKVLVDDLQVNVRLNKEIKFDLSVEEDELEAVQVSYKRKKKSTSSS